MNNADDFYCFRDSFWYLGHLFLQDPYKTEENSLTYYPEGWQVYCLLLPSRQLKNIGAYGDRHFLDFSSTPG